MSVQWQHTDRCRANDDQDCDCDADTQSDAIFDFLFWSLTIVGCCAYVACMVWWLR